VRAARDRDWLGGLSGAAAVLSGGAFLTLMGFLLIDALPALQLDFLLSPSTSRLPDGTGIGPAVVGSAWILLIAAVLALPVGIGTAVYLEEYARRRRTATAVGRALDGLAAVPPVVHGVVGLAVFVRALGMGATILAGGCTLAALALPAVVSTAREALRSVSPEVRLAAYSLGATKWQVVRRELLPTAAPSLVAGSCLTLSRAIGEAAPLLVLGAVSFITFVPAAPGDPLVSLPTQVFAWTTRAHADFAALAAAASVALLAAMVGLRLAGAVLGRALQRSAR